MILGVINLNAQISNSGFENWTDGEPDVWVANNLGNVFSAVSQSGEARTDSSALKLEMINVSTIFLGGNLTSGDDQALGSPVSERHSALNGYYKFLPNAGSNAFSV